MPSTKKGIRKNSLLQWYETMVLIRQTETQLAKLFSDGEIPGSIHLCVGQEAVSAGVMSALGPQDTITSTHRGHGHVLAKGIDLIGFFKELLGRSGGVCGGRGGSMHLADVSAGILGANGIVGGGISIALGSALAHQVRQTGAVAVALFGDGAQAEGILHECLNLASLWRLPLLFVCENNRWAEFSPTSTHFAADLRKLAEAFDLGFARVDGNDVEAVARGAETAVAALRGGGKPFVLECMTLRARGHYEGDPQKYRDPEELPGFEGGDPIARAADRLRALRHGEDETQEVEARVARRIAEAVREAREDAMPDFGRALQEVYTRVREN